MARPSYRNGCGPGVGIASRPATRSVAPQLHVALSRLRAVSWAPGALQRAGASSSPLATSRALSGTRQGGARFTMHKLTLVVANCPFMTHYTGFSRRFHFWCTACADAERTERFSFLVRGALDAQKAPCCRLTAVGGSGGPLRLPAGLPIRPGADQGRRWDAVQHHVFVRYAPSRAGLTQSARRACCDRGGSAAPGTVQEIVAGASPAAGSPLCTDPAGELGGTSPAADSVPAQWLTGSRSTAS